MKLKKTESLPIDLIKQFEINRLKEEFEKYNIFEILNPEDFDILEFYPDLLIKYINDIFLIHFIDEYVDKNELFFLSVLSLSFKKKYEEKNKGEVIIIFYVKKELTKEQGEVLKLAEKIFDMLGEIDIRNLDELKGIEDFPNYLEQKVWYQYFAYFKRYKEKGVI